MTKQGSFWELEYAAKKKLTRRDRFLAEIEAVTPWVELERTVVPFYPSSGGRGRGLAKNTAQLFSLFALSNLVLARRWLLNANGQVVS